MFIEKILEFSARFKWLLLASVLGIVVFSGIGLHKLRIDTRITSSPMAQTQIDDSLLIFFESPTLYTKKSLSALYALHQNLLALPGVQLKDLFSLPVFQFKENTLAFSPIFNKPPQSQQQIDEAIGKLYANPNYIGRLLTPDATVFYLTVDKRQIRSAADFLLSLKPLLAETRKEVPYVYLLGPMVIHDALLQALKKDLTTLTALAAGIIVLILFIWLRRLALVWIPLFSAALSLWITFGLMGFLNMPINILTAMLPTLVIVIGSTEDVYLIKAYLDFFAKRARLQDMTFYRENALYYVFKQVGGAVVLTVLTTCLGFLTNVFSDLQLIKDFSYAAAMAIFINGIVTLVFVPCVLHYLSKVINLGESHTRGQAQRSYWVVASRILVKMGKGLLFVILGVCFYFALYLPKLEVNNNPVYFFSKQSQIYREYAHFSHAFGGMQEAELVFQSSDPAYFLKPTVLKKLERIALLFSQGKYQIQSLSFVNELKALNQAFHEGDSTFFTLPTQTDLIAQYHFLLKQLNASSLISADGKEANLRFYYHLKDAALFNHLISVFMQQIHAIMGPLVSVELQGDSYQLQHVADTLLRNQLLSLALIIGIIFVFISILFMTVRAGIVTLLPNVLPIVVTYGVMAMLKMPVQPGTLMVAVIAIGISVDHTIHLILHYNRASRTYAALNEAVRYTLQHTMRPMVATTLALMLGFLVLGSSHFLLTQHFGLMAALAMLLALFCNLVITPVLLSKVRLVSLLDIASLKLDKAFLNKAELFQGMSRYDIRRAILLCEVRHFDAKEKILQQGDIGRSMYLILSGEVSVLHRSEVGESALALLRAGDTFGEMAYVTADKRSADVIAQTVVDVMEFNQQSLQRNMRFYPRLALKLFDNIARILGGRLARMNAHGLI